MERSSKKRAVIVGLFIFLGVIIFAFAILTLGGQKKTFSRSISVKAVFDDVNGLQKGNNVWFSGVKIGTVKRIFFLSNKEVEVDLNIDESSTEYIRKDAKAKISTDGLIGNKIVVIYSGSMKSGPVQEGDMLGVEKTVGTEEMMTTLQSNNTNLLDITGDIKVISARIKNGEGTLGKLSADETIALSLESTLKTLQSASENIQRISSDFNKFSSRLDDKGTLAYELANDTSTFRSLKASVAQMQKITTSANELITGLNTGLNDKTTPAGLLFHDQETATTIKNTIKNLETGSVTLNQDLEALQHNFLFRKYFKKQKRDSAKAK